MNACVSVLRPFDISVSDRRIRGSRGGRRPELVVLPGLAPGASVIATRVTNLGLQLLFDLAGVLVGQRAVPTGVGADLGPVEPDRAQLQNPISRAKSSACTTRPSIRVRNRRRNAAIVS